ncbi:MAG: hypothetical protein AAGI38_22565 [Bacteroidota bacterium]
MDLDLLLRYIVIPVISALVGWGTNVIALKMTFYPLEFMGIRKWNLGWQGIIPSKASAMAEKAVDLMTTKLIRIEEQFEKIEPIRVAEDMSPSMNRLVRRLLNESMEEEIPVLWENAPPALRERIYQRAQEDLPIVVASLMQEVKTDITTLFDLKKMVVEELEGDKALLNHIFQKVGEQEFKFIERSGLYFGFLFGIIQAAVFSYFRFWWILPVAGLINGYATNWLALKLIFEPQMPKRVLLWKIQGLFIKRQPEVAAAYARIIAQRIITSQNIFESMIQGPASDRLISIIQFHVKHAIDNIAGVGKSFFQLSQGTEKYLHLREQLSNKFIAELPISIKHMFAYAEEALDVEGTLREKMRALSPIEFEAFLRPVFQEDELKLIMVGGFLGMMAGLAQLLFFF